VLLNLVLNGCDSMKENTIGDRSLLIATERDGGEFICVRVTDRGNGVAPEVTERIFEPFYSTKPQGLGMGLSICRAIIRAHGGRLLAANNPDRGATFHFTLQVGEEKRS
jgi:signal transduction histidine kinase